MQPDVVHAYMKQTSVRFVKGEKRNSNIISPLILIPFAIEMKESCIAFSNLLLKSVLRLVSQLLLLS